MCVVAEQIAAVNAGDLSISKKNPSSDFGYTKGDFLFKTEDLEKCTFLEQIKTVFIRCGVR